MKAENRPALAVVLKGWPRLSETFIAQELVALEEAGLDFEVWSLRHPTDTTTHPLHDRLRAPVHYLPEYLGDAPMRVARGVFRALGQPGLGALLRTALRDLRRDRTPNRFRRIGQACVLAREMPPDVAALYAHFLHTPSSVARYAAILRGVEWSFSAHAKDIWTTSDWELREKLSGDTFGAAFGATCTAIGARYLRERADTPARVDLVYHGLDLARFPDPPSRATRAPDALFALCSVGRLVEKKGFDRLIDALALLPSDLDWRWTHIGGGALGPDLADRAEARGIASRICWRGAAGQPEVIAAMRQADLFVLPSRVAEDGDRDGLPNVLMEAASQKLPILSTPVSAIPEFIDDGVHGVLCRGEPEALAAAIEQLARDPAKAHRLAEAAFTRLHASFRMAPGITVLHSRLRDLIAAAA